MTWGLPGREHERERPSESERSESGSSWTTWLDRGDRRAELGMARARREMNSSEGLGLCLYGREEEEMMMNMMIMMNGDNNIWEGGSQVT